MSAKKSPSEGETETLLSLLARIEQLIDRVQHLYRMFEHGVEKTPPRESRATLEALMTQLRLRLQKSGVKTDEKFRAQTLLDRYALYRIRWEREARSRES